MKTPRTFLLRCPSCGWSTTQWWLSFCRCDVELVEPEQAITDERQLELTIPANSNSTRDPAA